MDILTLLKANIKHKKGAFKSIIILTFIVTTVFSAVVSNYDSMAETANQLLDDINCGDYFAFIPNAADSNSADPNFTNSNSTGSNFADSKSIIDGLNKNENVKSCKTEDCLITNSFTVNGNKVTNTSYLLLKWDGSRSIFNENETKLNRDAKEPGNGEIYLPFTLSTKYDCKIGDKFELETAAGKKGFTIKAFTQEPILGGLFMGLKHIYISGNDYNELAQQTNELAQQTNLFNTQILHIYINEDCKLSNADLSKSLNETSKVVDNAFFFTSKSTLAYYNLIFNRIISGVLYTFLIILFIATVVIVCHSISTGIEMEYVNLGILKANGFSNGKIRLVYILQYLIAQLIGIILGASVSYPLSYLLGKVCLPITGILLGGSISAIKILIAAITMILIVFLVVILFTAKIGKISPVKAIQGGINQIYFDSRLNTKIRKKSLSLSLALRQFISNKSHYAAMLIICVLLVYFTMSATLVAFNMSNDEMFNIFGNGTYDISGGITKSGSNSIDDIKNEIKKISQINSITIGTNAYVTFMNSQIACTVYKDSDSMQSSLIKGRIPKYDNEILITEIVADEFNLKIGDKVTVATDQGRAEYIISGLNQDLIDVGMNITMHYDAFNKINNNFYPAQIFISLKDKDCAQKVTDMLNEKFKDKIKVKKVESDAGDDMLKLIANILAVAVYIISILFTFVSVNMVCKKSFLREKMDIGIYKAIGFTAQKLRLQFSLRFMIISILGLIIGCIACIFTSCRMFEILLRGMGVTNFAAAFTPLTVLVPVCVFCVSSFLFAYFSSRKIKSVAINILINE